MEKILLCNSAHTVCAFGQAVGIKLCHDAFNPYVNRECINFSETVKEGALSNLFADPFDFNQFISAFFKRRGTDFFKIDFP